MAGKLLVALALLLVAPVQDDDDDKAKERIKEFKEELRKAKTDTDVIDAVETLGGQQHERILAELIPLLGRFSAVVRLEVASQIAEYEKNVKAAEALLKRASTTKDVTLAAHYLKCVGKIRERRTAKPLAAFFTRKEIEIAKSSIRASGKIKSRDSIPPLIKLAQKLEKTDRTNQGHGAPNPGPKVPNQANQNDDSIKFKKEILPEIFLALRDITGERFRKGDEWKEWWDRNAKTWKEPED